MRARASRAGRTHATGDWRPPLNPPREDGAPACRRPEARSVHPGTRACPTSARTPVRRMRVSWWRGGTPSGLRGVAMPRAGGRHVHAAAQQCRHDTRAPPRRASCRRTGRPALGLRGLPDRLRHHRHAAGPCIASRARCNPAVGLDLVMDDDRYSLANHCNHATVRWLRALGVRAGPVPAVARFHIRPPATSARRHPPDAAPSPEP